VYLTSFYKKIRLKRLTAEKSNSDDIL